MTVEVNEANIIALINGNSVLSAVASAHRGDDAQLNAACNAVSSSVTLPGDPITPAAFTDLLDGDEYRTFTQPVFSQLGFLTAAGTVVMGSSATQEKLDGILAPYSKSLAAVQARYTRNGSLWEGQFGKGLSSNQDWLDKARNFGSGNNF